MTAPCPILGFVVRLALAPGTDPHAVIDPFVDLLDRRGLACTGRGQGIWELTVTSVGSQATELDREAAFAWLSARGGDGIARFDVGPLRDLA